MSAAEETEVAESDADADTPQTEQESSEASAEVTERIIKNPKAMSSTSSELKVLGRNG